MGNNSSLHTKFQLDMFIFEELATDQTLLQFLCSKICKQIMSLDQMRDAIDILLEFVSR